jgi:nucleotidyltransferase/DNA polymerase involved in DNA repair
MTFACVQIPNVALARARRDEPALARQPLVVYTPHPTRSLVYAASEEIAIAPGMPLRQALVACPDAACRAAEPARDAALVAELAGLLESFSPRATTGAALPHAAIELDIGRMSRRKLFTLLQQIEHTIRARLRLAPAIGVGSTRWVALRGADTAGAGAVVAVPTGWEAAFLAPQPISSLPLDAEIIRRLDRLGLRTLGAIAALPLDALQAQFGAAGIQLHQLAHGIDDMPIGRTQDEPQVARTRWFVGALLDRTLLERAIAGLAAWLAADLQAGGWSTRALALTMVVEDGAPVTLEQSLPEATTDTAALTQTLLALSRRARIASGVEGVTVTATALAPLVTAQLDLFPPERGMPEQLRNVLERLGSRHAGSLLRATLSAPQAPLPERRIRLDPAEPA